MRKLYGTVLAACAAALVAGISLNANAQAEATDDPEQVVRDLYTAFEEGDMAAIETLIAPDATWTYYGPPSALPFGGVRRGPEGVGEFFAKVAETLDNPVAGQTRFLVDGDTVIVPGFEESTVRKTGIRYRADNVHIFRVRDGKIVQFEEFIDSGKVLLAFQGDDSVAVGKSAVAATATSARADGNVDKSVGKAVFTTCVGCHGNDGQGRAMMFAPNLTGLDSVYITRQLENFRQGRRGKVEDAHGFPMVGRATAIGDADNLTAVVRYIGTLPDAPAAKVAQRTAPADLAGQLATCATCHGQNGEGNVQMGGPAINTLDSDYIALQLTNFRSGVRGYDENDAQGQLMAAAATAIRSDDDVVRIAEHYGR